ncbi:methylated-DNA--[protein]-cysteine S-methyltransferase [Spiroplasma alleghenense]|uniref:Methylated-DNA-[protein]-cysteine S-methyltransferase n=1 Tax=Spiroplasma alleghenense TaxID=216931 RepID=A0A345Z2X1_9MOLU|nr:methylated-DNA--[protein]-cysteine S-methyltransferase [Spiroplasma alleghenense]AXK50950.1 methylated-DNA-[protein]-cysteine S-methyltransferase [Spiroplasma alleghenense]
MLKKVIHWNNFKYKDHSYLIATIDGKIAYLNTGEDAIDDFNYFAKKHNLDLFEDENLIDLGKSTMSNYFNNKTKLNFEDFYLFGTDFQIKVWRTTFSIPWGVNISYQELGEKIKKPKSARAIGSALGANPILILIPCHRIVAKSRKVNYKSGPGFKIYLQKIENGTNT